MIRLPPRSPRTATPFPYATLGRSPSERNAAPRLSRPSRPQAAILAKSENVLGTWHSVLTMEIIEEDSSLHHREWVDGSEYSGRGFDRTMERSEEHTSELQSLIRISYAVFCLNKKHNIPNIPHT